MRWSSALAVFAALLVVGMSAAALPCPGDLNGDGVVTVDEILTMADAAVNGCPVAGCPGDLNDDGIVTVDEILQAVNAALDGCPGVTYTPTSLPSTPTATATETPPPPSASATPTPSETATPSTCPYTFLDDTLTLGVSCDYLGPFNADPTCPGDLEALFSASKQPDGTLLLGVAIDTIDMVTFVATVDLDSPTLATLQGYTVGMTDPTVFPVRGTVQLQQNGSVLVISPDTSPFDLGSDTGQCAFVQYTGTYIGVLSGQAARAVPRTAPRRSVVARNLQPVAFHLP